MVFDPDGKLQVTLKSIRDLAERSHVNRKEHLSASECHRAIRMPRACPGEI